MQSLCLDQRERRVCWLQRCMTGRIRSGSAVLCCQSGGEQQQQQQQQLSVATTLWRLKIDEDGYNTSCKLDVNISEDSNSIEVGYYYVTRSWLLVMWCDMLPNVITMGKCHQKVKWDTTNTNVLCARTKFNWIQFKLPSYPFKYLCFDCELNK